MYYGKNYELYREYSDSSIDLKSRYLTIILKILLITILLGVIYFGYSYLSNMKYGESIQKIEVAPIQTQCVAELTADDISQIVSMVVDKIKRDNRDIAKISDSDYSKRLMNYNIGGKKKELFNNLNINLEAKDNRVAEVNSENRVVIESDKRVFDIPLEVKNIIKNNYIKNIEKEIKYRESEMKIIVVKRGDSLSKIAKRAYGNSKDYNRILKANPQLSKNPNLLYVGQKLRIP